ncbi:MAG: NAD(P)/FAD-dependent oxidoreductase [Cyanophyceae cyanobacterium]
MTHYDWIVVGGGITGAALGYELAQKGFQVLLLEKNVQPDNATLYSYGGLAYWSGTTALSRQLCAEGIELHRQLSAELEADTEFRELELLLTINTEDDPQAVANSYEQFAIPPRLLNIKEACELEPLLNPKAIAGALHLPHGHINAHKTTAAYLQAFERAGGEFKIEPVVELLHQRQSVQGVRTPSQSYCAANTAICAGGLSRSLLKAAGIDVPVYFTHEQVIMTPPAAIELRTLVMPAVLQRFALEEQASSQSEWDAASRELVPPILDPGAIQFVDGTFCLGQISQALSDPHAAIDAAACEEKIRTGIATILPSLSNLPGTLQSCLVAFAPRSRPLVGAIANFSGVHLFSGFTSTLVFAPPLARHFAHWAAGEDVGLIDFQV